MSKPHNARQQQFIDIIETNRPLISRICFMYAQDDDHFNDLYQEVLINLWQGIEHFEGRSKVSTWIYRTCINTCISCHRRSRRHTDGRNSLDAILELPADDTNTPAHLKQMYDMIAMLNDFDKGLIMMWLDELSYDEISAITGLNRNNVASRLRRIKLKLIRQANS